MVFAEIESQLRTEGGWNMHIAIALIVALLVTAGVLWFFFAPRKAYRAPVRDGVQEAVVEVKGGYNPAVIEAEAGMPLRLIFDRKEDGECSSHVVFSDFGVDLALPAFRTTTLTLHPDQPGEYPFACGMNMLHGTLRILPGKHASVGAAAGSAVGSVGASMSDSGDSDIRATADGAHASGSAETGVQCAQKGAVQTSGSGDSGKSRGSESEIRALITRLIVAAVCTIPVFGSTMLMLYPMPNWLQFLLMLPIVGYAALPIFRSGFAAIAHRSPEMNALVSLGALAAFAYSCVVTFAPNVLPENAREPYFEAVGVVVTLMLVGQLLEARARKGTGEAMRALAGLQPKTARVVRDGKETSIAIDDVRVGDIIAIRPGEQLPVDGIVTVGRCAYRRIDDHRRSHAGRQNRGQRSDGRHHQRWWLAAVPRHESRQGHRARADHRHGGRRTKLEGSRTAIGGPHFRHIRADRGARRRMVVRAVVRARPRPACHARAGRRGIGAADRLPVRARTGDSVVGDGLDWPRGSHGGAGPFRRSVGNMRQSQCRRIG